jgi:hypothetical protein
MLKLGARCMSYTLPGILTTPEVPKDVDPLIKPISTYKPLQQLIFNTKFETLVYSADNLPKFKVFFPLPWSLGTWSSPVVVWQMLVGVIPVNFFSLAALYVAFLPHLYYLNNLRYTIDKIWYIRGGHWKLELTGVSGFTTFVTCGPESLEILNNPNLNSSESLSNDVKFNSKKWTDFFYTYSNRRLTLPGNGKVVNPELFEAMMKKFKIDDSNFVIDQDLYLA